MMEAVHATEEWQRAGVHPQNERTKEFLRKMQLLNEPEYVI